MWISLKGRYELDRCKEIKLDKGFKLNYGLNLIFIVFF